MTPVILHSKFGSLWTNPWPDKISIFLKIEKAKKSIFPKRPIFQNYLILTIRNNRKFTYEKLTFFLGKLYQEFFSCLSLPTLEILHSKFGSLWTTPWPDKISIFLKIEKAKKWIFPIEIRTIFLWKLGGHSSCITT